MPDPLFRKIARFFGKSSLGICVFGVILRGGKKRNPVNSTDLQGLALKCEKFSGERGIRTLGPAKRDNSFRDCPDRPLRHLSFLQAAKV